MSPQLENAWADVGVKVTSTEFAGAEGKIVGIDDRRVYAIVQFEGEQLKAVACELARRVRDDLSQVVDGPLPAELAARVYGGLQLLETLLEGIIVGGPAQVVWKVGDLRPAREHMN